jgi:hypothetical protein
MFLASLLLLLHFTHGFCWQQRVPLCGRGVMPRLQRHQAFVRPSHHLIMQILHVPATPAHLCTTRKKMPLPTRLLAIPRPLDITDLLPDEEQHKITLFMLHPIIHFVVKMFSRYTVYLVASYLLGLAFLTIKNSLYFAAAIPNAINAPNVPSIFSRGSFTLANSRDGQGQGTTSGKKTKLFECTICGSSIGPRRGLESGFGSVKSAEQQYPTRCHFCGAQSHTFREVPSNDESSSHAHSNSNG